MATDKPTFGFVSAREQTGGTFLGGYLVTNHLGRPLEFQCTTPIRPNRSQRILYGPTLMPYLLGELIGRTLVVGAAVKPDLVLTDCAGMLALRESIAMPLAYVASPTDGENANADPTPSGDGITFGQAQPMLSPVATTENHTGRLFYDSRFREDRLRVQRFLRSAEVALDLTEPFSRIRVAMDEVHRPAGAR